MPEYAEQVSRKRIVFTVIFFVVLVGGVFLIKYITDNPDKGLFDSKEEVAETKPQAPVLDAPKVADDIKSGKTFDQVAEENPGIITNPNAGYQEVKELIADINPEPKVVEIVYNGNSFTPVDLQIRQGDFVTWLNQSNKELMIVGQNWGTFIPVPPTSGFTQTFDFKGRYPYTDTDGTVSGVVVVE